MKDLRILHHLETYIGKIDGAWSEFAAGSKAQFQVLKFERQPVQTAVTCCTLGLSENVLKQIDGSVCRQELIFCCYESCFNEDVPALLASLGEEILGSGNAVARGQALTLNDIWSNGCSNINSLYCTSPVYFPPSLSKFDGSVPPTIFVWLVPIFKEEAQFISTHGWEAFEEELEENDPDLMNFKRERFIHC
jgi:hypothetical protein